MNLLLVRHGDAHAGFAGVIGGPTGCAGLTDLGRAQAALLRDDLASTCRYHVDRLVTSMIPRAIETASIVAPALGFVAAEQHCELCEVHTGEADGLTWVEYPTRFGSFDMASEPDRPFAPGGDSWNSFHRRVSDVMDRFATDNLGETVMAVCHAGVIAASLRIRFGAAERARTARLVPTNTGITELEHDPATDVWTLRCYDDARHLD
jgi:probable phosphoglycerate mutase